MAIAHPHYAEMIGMPSTPSLSWWMRACVWEFRGVLVFIGMFQFGCLFVTHSCRPLRQFLRHAFFLQASPSDMSQQLSPEHKELYKRIDEVLHYLWDPIGVSDVPEACDEYDSYVPHVFSLLVRRTNAQEIADFLDHTATQTMGLSSTERGREHSKEVVSILERWRDVIHERYGRDA